MVPSKRTQRIEEMQEEYKRILQEESEMLIKRLHALAAAQSKAEKEAVKALYKDLLAPIRSNKYSIAVKLKKFAEREADRKDDGTDTVAFRMFGKRYAELNPFEKAQYNRYKRKRSYLLRRITKE